MNVVRETSVPILLIHGGQDRNIDVRHSRAIHAANPRVSRLWVVPGADHVRVLSTAPAEYMRETLHWFERR